MGSIEFESCVRVGATCVCAGIAALGICVLFDADHLGPVVFGRARGSVVSSAQEPEYLKFLQECYDTTMALPGDSLALHFILPAKFCITKAAFLSDLAHYMSLTTVLQSKSLGSSTTAFGGKVPSATELSTVLTAGLKSSSTVATDATFPWVAWVAIAAAIAVGLFLITAALKKKEPEVSSVKNTVSLKAVREAEPRLFSYSSRRISNIELGDVQPAVRLDTEETLQLAISDFLLLLNPSTVEHVTVLTALV